MNRAISSMSPINSLRFLLLLPCCTNNESPGTGGPGQPIAMTNPPIGTSHTEPPMFPMFLKLARRRCLVVGATALAEPKIESLLAAGAVVLVVAPRATARVEQWTHAGQISWERRRFKARDLHGIVLVVAATSSRSTNQAIFEEARARRVLCNAVDDKEHCDFYYPAVVRRGRLQIAISTGGASPALAQALRHRLEKQFGPEYEAWVDWLAESRNAVFAQHLSRARRRILLHRGASQQSLTRFLQRRSRNVRVKGPK